MPRLVIAQRSLNHQNIATSISNGVWATQPHNEKKLADAFDSGEEARLAEPPYCLIAISELVLPPFNRLCSFSA